MNGHLIPNSNIAVDFWKRRGISTKYIHFLTHTHGDHIVGLTSSWQEPIFCSEITAYLLIERHGIPRSLLNILPLNESVIIDVSESFTVTTYDANHCPGAVMFYFEGNFGNVLYTGDFRLSEEFLRICHNLSEKVDLLYLDNTYCSPQCVFPSQKECLNQIIDIIKQHPDHRVLIGVRKLGKETLLGQLGVILNETISVSSERSRLCKALFNTDNIFTTHYLKDGTTRLITVPMQEVAKKVNLCNRESPTIGIIPTAIFTDSSPDYENGKIFVVPYSDHSNYTELERFVEKLKPSKIVPIVTSTKGPNNSNISDRVQMSCFSRYLSSRPINTLQSYSRAKTKDIAFTNLRQYENISRNKKRKQPLINKRPKKKAMGVVYDEDSDEVCEHDDCINGKVHIVDIVHNVDRVVVNAFDLMTEDNNVDSLAVNTIDLMKKDDKVDSEAVNTIDRMREDDNVDRVAVITSGRMRENDNVDQVAVNTSGRMRQDDNVESVAVNTIDCMREDDNVDQVVVNTIDQMTKDDNVGQVAVNTINRMTEDDNVDRVAVITSDRMRQDDNFERVAVNTIDCMTEDDNVESVAVNTIDRMTENDNVESVAVNTIDHMTEDDNVERVAVNTIDRMTEDDNVESVAFNTSDRMIEYDNVDSVTVITIDLTTEDDDVNRVAVNVIDLMTGDDNVERGGFITIDLTTEDDNVDGMAVNTIDLTTEDDNVDRESVNTIDLTTEEGIVDCGAVITIDLVTEDDNVDHVTVNTNRGYNEGSLDSPCLIL